jgi:hypothetical protein
MKARITSLICAVAVLTACSDSTGLDGGTTRVSLSFSTAPAGQAMLSVAAADTMSDGQNQLILSSVEVVLREIELKRVDVVDCDVEPEPLGCESFETGPMLVSVPLNGSTTTAVSIDIDAGTYDEVE